MRGGASSQSHSPIRSKKRAQRPETLPQVFADTVASRWGRRAKMQFERFDFGPTARRRNAGDLRLPAATR